MTNPNVEKYWKEFLESLPRESPYHGRTFFAESFGDNPRLAEELGQLIRSGDKTGTCSALWEWEADGNLLPQPGFISIVLDGYDQPMCIIETTEVYVCRFNAVDQEFAYSEGEGDRSLDYWRKAHMRYFSRVLTRIGKQFSEEMPIVCERFRVIYK